MKQQPPKLYTIRKDKLDIWHSWCEKLRTSLRDEAQEIITNEGLLSEFFVEFKLNDDYYTLGAMIVAPDMINATKDTLSAINREHTHIMRECLIPVGPAEFSYLLYSTDQTRLT